MQALDRLDGLVFTFYGDPFNEPRDLEHLAEIPGIVFVASEPCTNNAHLTALRDCSWNQYEDKVRAFIKSRVLKIGD